MVSLFNNYQQLAQMKKLIGETAKYRSNTLNGNEGSTFFTNTKAQSCDRMLLDHIKYRAEWPKPPAPAPNSRRQGQRQRQREEQEEREQQEQERTQARW